MEEFTIGIDFGSNSARALIIGVSDGKEYGSSAFTYEVGDNGVYIDPKNHNLARQNPESYLEAMRSCVVEALRQAESDNPDFSADRIIGIGIDATASTPIPVTKELAPLSSLPEFQNNLNAYAWMWKDHCSTLEAEAITQAARKQHPEYLAKCGGSYSSEWFWSKVWHCMNVDRKVFDAAYTWLDFPDFIPIVLGGITDISEVKGGICAAGHKSLYNEEWGGFPENSFLSGLSPELFELKKRLFLKAVPSDTVAADLCADWARKLHLPEGIPIAVGIIDAHSGAVGAGVGAGRMVKVIGTSSCDIVITPKHGEIPEISGICGIVDGSVVPRSLGIEAGQSAVGDIFNWFVSKVCDSDHSLFGKLKKEAQKLEPGESGLLALDWQNGNRNILCDQELSGLILGMTLHTTQAEIYRALLEATAFGAKKILERLEEYDITVNEIICCGGIAEKDEMFMQLYADILGRKLLLSASEQTCALGAAMFGAVAAGKFPTIEDAQCAICRFKDKTYEPKPENVVKYAKLYKLYSELHDSFGINQHSKIMKQLISLKKR